MVVGLTLVIRSPADGAVSDNDGSDDMGLIALRVAAGAVAAGMIGYAGYRVYQAVQRNQFREGATSGGDGGLPQ